MNKKISMLMLSLLMAFTFVACGGTETPESESSSVTSSIEETTESSNDSTVESSEEASDSDSDIDSESASGDSSVVEKAEITVTFQQDGEEDIVITLTEGESLTDIPTPVGKTGYTITWDRTDFANLTESITVKAMETAKTYTVTLQGNGGYVAQETLTVTYGQAYTLPVPTHNEHVFDCWTYAGNKVANQGVWELDANDIVLTVEWNEGYWSGNY